MKRLSAYKQMMIAVAGHVAECCWERSTCAAEQDWPESFLDNLWDPDGMSATDWEMALHEPGCPTKKLARACEAVERLLSSKDILWADLVGASRRLIVEARNPEVAE